MVRDLWWKGFFLFDVRVYQMVQWQLYTNVVVANVRNTICHERKTSNKWTIVTLLTVTMYLYHPMVASGMG